MDGGATRWDRIVARRQPPRRRARLPSPTSISELMDQRAEWIRLGRPRRLDNAGRIRDTERLVGLMMVRSENDILAEHLRLATRYFDRILVLDGTPVGPERVECHRILGNFREVVEVTLDDGLPGPTRDGARQVLLEQARSRWGVDQWIGILHADELHLRDPRPVLAALHPIASPVVRVRLLHFFLGPAHAESSAHGVQVASSAQSPGSGMLDGSALDQVTSMMWPGLPESRFFFDSGIHDYDPTLHSKVVPTAFRTGPLIDGYLLPQLNFRSVEQAQARAIDRVGRNWQTAHYLPIAQGGDVRAATWDLGADRRAGGANDRLLGSSRATTSHLTPVGPRRRDTLVPVFVGGTGRCGSTLVKTLLAQALGASSARYEWKALSAPGGLCDLAERPTRRGLLRLGHRLRDMRPLVGAEEDGTVTSNWGYRLLDGNPPFAGYDAATRLLLHSLGSDRLTPGQRRRAAADFVATVWESVIPWDATQWVEQTPADVEHAGDLLSCFPAGHVVFVRRKPIDIVASLVARPWGPSTAPEAARHVLAVHRRWCEQVEAARYGDSQHLHVIRFEDVLADPSGTLGQLVAAIGQPPAMMATFEVPAAPRLPKSGNDLPADERAHAQRILAPLTEEWGYA